MQIINEIKQISCVTGSEVILWVLSFINEWVLADNFPWHKDLFQERCDGPDGKAVESGLKGWWIDGNILGQRFPTAGTRTAAGI